MATADTKGRGERGAALIEFALIFGLLATVVFGAIDLGRAFFTWNQVKNAAREGAVYAERDPWSSTPAGAGCANPNNIRYRAQNEGGSTRTELVVTTKHEGATYTGCQSPSSLGIDPGDEITVTVSTPFEPVSPFGGAIFGDREVYAEVTVVVQ